MPEIVQIDLEGQLVPVEINHNRRAKRLQFRLDGRTSHVKLTLPPGVDEKRGLNFVREKADWLLPRRAKILANQIQLNDGVLIPLNGSLLPLRFGTKAYLGDNQVVVRPASPGKDLANLLKNRAKAALTPLAHDKAAVLGLPIQGLGFRDTTSRWGACTSDGILTFNWRIVCADLLIQDYVVAHEVAHLKELHHQPPFWAQCASLMTQPHLMEEARAKLRTIGPRLMALPLG